MATVYLIVLAAVITVVTAGQAALPACKDCEICVGVIPLRPGGCQLPVALSPTYDMCPVAAAAPPPKICPCIDSTATLAVDLVTGMPVAAQITALGVVISGSANPVAIFTKADCRVQAVISADSLTVACDPFAVKTGGACAKVEGLCAGKMVNTPNLIGPMGVVTNFMSAQFTSMGTTCTALRLPVLEV